MVNKRTPPTVAAAPTPPLPIGSEQDARELLGADHGLERIFRRPLPPVAVYELPGEGGVLPPLSSVTVEGLGWPGAPPSALHRLELSHDPQRSPPLTCRVDGVPVELEQHSDGVWRPRRAESNG